MKRSIFMLVAIIGIVGGAYLSGCAAPTQAHERLNAFGYALNTLNNAAVGVGHAIIDLTTAAATVPVATVYPPATQPSTQPAN